jgi:DNA-binding MarR family transcriptional regulator
MKVAHEVAMALRTAYWAMHRQADACLQAFGVTANQFVLLSLLAEEDGITQRELVERASSDANTVGAMLVALEEKGLVMRGRHPDDGRARRVTLTRTGREAYKRLWAKSEPFRDRLLDALRPGEPEALLDTLGRLTAALDRRERELSFHKDSPIPGGSS